MNCCLLVLDKGLVAATWQHVLLGNHIPKTAELLLTLLGQEACFTEQDVSCNSGFA